MLTTIIIFLVLSANQFNFQKTQAKQNTPAKTNTITENDSTYPSIRIITDVSDDPNTPFSLNYPQADNDIFNETILTYINDSKKEYLAKLKKNEMNAKESEAPPGKLSINLETYSYKDQYLSFVLTKELSTGNTNKTITTKTFVYNIKTKKLMQLSTLLNQDEHHLTTLAKHLQNQLSQESKIKDTLIAEKLQMATKPLWENFDCFALTDDSLIFYFDNRKLTDTASGITVLPISLSFINPILSTDFQIQMEDVKTILSSEQKPTNQKLVALTFDDGPHPDVTPRILSILNKYHAKATFFMLGNRVKNYPDIAKSVASCGHEIGNHTWSHPILTKLTMEEILYEFNSTDQAIYEATGQHPTLFRPPYGATNDNIKAQIPVPTVIWSIDTLDWKHRNAQQLVTNVQNSLHNNAIILMHDIHPTTADAMDPLLAYLQQQGYQFVTVSEILASK